MKISAICPNCLAYLKKVPEMGWVTCPYCGAEVVAKVAREMYFYDPEQGRDYHSKRFERWRDLQAWARYLEEGITGNENI